MQKSTTDIEPDFNRKYSTHPIAIISAILLMIMSSCGGNDYSELSPMMKRALDNAGKNKSELEEVLSHYSDHPEKFKAACFLIENMPGHYGYEGEELDSIEMALSPLTKYSVNFSLPDSVKNKWNHFPFFALPRIDDIRSIKAKYLIDNIDLAYEQYKARPWNKTLAFEDFCELILPYCVSDERLTDWRSLYLSHYGSKLDSLYSGDSSMEAANVLARILAEEGMVYNDELSTPHRDAVSLFNNRIGFYRDKCDLFLYAMRACGIPVAQEMTLISPDTGTPNQWISVRDSKTGHFYPIDFNGKVMMPEDVAENWRNKGKVYRYCFARQPELDRKTAAIRSLPLKLNSPYMLDVTANYTGHCEIEIPVVSDRSTVFLSLYNCGRGILLPVDIGSNRDGKVIFKDVEPGVIFVPTILSRTSFVPCGPPFLVNSDGTTHLFVPDTLHMERVVLNRIMPTNPLNSQRLSTDLYGAVLEAIGPGAHSRPDTLMAITDTVRTNYLKLHPNPGKTYEFLRYSVPKGKRLVIAELKAFRDAACTDEIPLTVISEAPPRYRKECMVDNDFFSCYTAPEGTTEVVVRLEKPSRIGCVVYAPRNDDFFVWHKDAYELFYLNHNQWVSLGKKYADDDHVEFMAPKNSLMLLVDLTRNKPSNYFLWVNGRQKFSYDFGYIPIISKPE